MTNPRNKEAYYEGWADLEWLSQLGLPVHPPRGTGPLWAVTAHRVTMIPFKTDMGMREKMLRAIAQSPKTRAAFMAYIELLGDAPPREDDMKKLFLSDE